MTKIFLLNQTFGLYRMRTGDDGFGGSVKTWTHEKNVWGSVKFVSHRKISQKSHLLVQKGIITDDGLFVEIIVRSKICIKVADRIKWQNYTLCIVCDPIPCDRQGYVIFYACKLNGECQ